MHIFILLTDDVKKQAQHKKDGWMDGWKVNDGLRVNYYITR